MRRILFILMMLTVGAVVEAQTPYRGVDFTTLHLSPVDSALLRMNSVMYSGWDVDGVVTSSKSTVYIKWAKNPEKYYPVMREAWKYCIDHAPYQVRLYKEGGRFFQEMIGVAKDDSVKRMNYCNELMGLYDQRIQHLDSINAHVKRVSDKSSKGNMMLHKAFTYDYYILGAPEGGDYANGENKAEERKRVMYPMYKNAVNVIKKSIEEGSELGGDVETEFLHRFFILSYWHFVDSLNKYRPAKDSIGIKKYADAKTLFLSEYDFMKDFCNTQIEELGKDYADTLSTEVSDSLEVIQEKVLTPYKTLLAYCDEYIRFLEENRILYVSSRTMEDTWANYAADLESHKDSLMWLRRLQLTYENTQDFAPDSEYYPDYEKVLKYIKELTAKAQTSGDKPRPPKEQNKYYILANCDWFRGRTITLEVGERALLSIHYLKLAANAEPGKKDFYYKYINWLAGSVLPRAKGELFMKGISEGKTITVNGVTFKAHFQ